MNKSGYFDDCEICKAMREADSQGRDLSSEELKAAIDKQNKENKKKDKEF